MFSIEVRKKLVESLWYEGRKIDTGAFKFVSLRNGYFWTENVRHFLEEFGNLKIAINRESIGTDFFHFDVVKAMNDFDPRWIKENYSRRLNGTQLCVIGQAFSNHLTLMMSEDGKVYGGFDDFLTLLGGDGRQAIENICKGEKGTEVK
jgi:hypothetical protein